MVPSERDKFHANKIEGVPISRWHRRPAKKGIRARGQTRQGHKKDDIYTQQKRVRAVLK